MDYFSLSTNYKSIPCPINSHSSIGKELSKKTAEHFLSTKFLVYYSPQQTSLIVESQNNIIIKWTVEPIAQAKKEIKEVGCLDLTPLIVALPYQK